MANLLLAVIFLSFISLGLSDAALGATWPAMYGNLGVPISTAGIISLAVTVCTFAAALLSVHVRKRFGTGVVILASTILIGLALLGFSLAPSLYWILAFTLPLGLGGGSLVAGMNSFIVLHYKAQHVNWLQGFWGLGAMLSPIIIAQVLAQTGNWRVSYRILSLVQISTAAILLLILPLWKKVENKNRNIQLAPALDNAIRDVAEDAFVIEKGKATRKSRILILVLLIFFLYAGTEMSIGLWGSSFLVKIHGLSVESASRWVALYFAGIMVGRFLTGFLSLRFPIRRLIRVGITTSLAGSLLMLASGLASWLALPAFILLGLGFAPVIPCMIHLTPEHFDKDRSQVLIGYQMGAGFVGSTVIPPMIGLLAYRWTLGFLPLLILAVIALLMMITELIARRQA